ncbi:MAG: EamA family transporter [Gemmatimonadetes bacterium]|nr:EamA family transporter [Gemmatimonadota bacterium]
MVHVVLLLTQALLASLAIAAKLALRELPAAGLVLLRVGGAGLVLAAVVPRARLASAFRADLPSLALYSLLGVVANQLLYVGGLTHTTAINANILITTVPVFTLAIAALLGRERATPVALGGLALALAGALVLVRAGDVDLQRERSLGNAMIVMNALAYAGYLVLSKDLLARYPPLVVTAAVFLLGTVGVLPFGAPALATLDWAAVSSRTWLAVLYIILVPTAAAYGLSLWALSRSSSTVVAVYVYVQPLVTMLLAPAVLGESVGVDALVAGAAIFAGIALVTLGRRERPVGDEVREEVPETGL